MLLVPSSAGKHHHHCLPEQLNALQDDTKKAAAAMPLKFNAKKTAQSTLVSNNNMQVDTLPSIKQQQPADIVEAMRNLDAKLVAYLSAGDNGSETESVSLDNKTMITSNSIANNYNNNENHTAFMSIGSGGVKCTTASEHAKALSLDNDGIKPITPLFDDLSTERSTLAKANENSLFTKYKRVSALKLHMEALTLQPDGIKYMDLLQTEIRPIFTVECQLSHELIDGVPRYDMFHVMQFESSKFQSFTQCTRFGQAAEREVHLQLRESDVADATTDKQLKIGSLRFAVWWREPGTCINEMLGIGVLELVELYEMALFEQCTTVKVCKRGVHFGSLFFKISLLSQRPTMVYNNMRRNELLAIGCHLDNSDKNDSDSDHAEQQRREEQNKSMNNQQQQAASGSGNVARNIETANTAGKNNAQSSSQLLESSYFSAETSEVRLLKGFLYANETRNLSSVDILSAPLVHDTIDKCEFILVCRRFWQEEAAATAAGMDCAFNYQEQFPIIIDQHFLQSVHKSHLQLELWRRSNLVCDANSNPKIIDNVEPFGVVRLPLHHFFIAYRDAAITNHICKGRMPVISIDAWVPIQKANGVQQNIGELKCLLAIGSEEQISNLKVARGFSDISKVPLSPISKMVLASCLKPTSVDDTSNTNQHADLLHMLQKVLNKRKMSEQPYSMIGGNTAAKSCPPAKSYQLLLDVNAARNLPYNTVKRKKGARRRNGNGSSVSLGMAGNSKRNGNSGAQGESPTCYVTFQADTCVGHSTYKSHEGQVYATSVVENCCQPKWGAQFRLSVDGEYLTSSQKFFVLKVWRKTAQSIANQIRPFQPTPMDDAIIGFVALDLTAFRHGAAHINGWFNIVDFNGRVNGQLDVCCVAQPPLQAELSSPAISSNFSNDTITTVTGSVETFIEQFESSLDLTHLNIGQSIKRKYTELEGISQRLRSRLTNVTGMTLSPVSDMTVLNTWQPTDVETIELIDEDWNEFEHDINTTPPQIDVDVNGDSSAIIELNDKKNSTNVKPDTGCDGK